MRAGPLMKKSEDALVARPALQRMPGLAGESFGQDDAQDDASAGHAP
ncbi:hypothetical protein [Streptomyces sp. NBC_00063]